MTLITWLRSRLSGFSTLKLLLDPLHPSHLTLWKEVLSTAHPLGLGNKVPLLGRGSYLQSLFGVLLEESFACSPHAFIHSFVGMDSWAFITPNCSGLATGSSFELVPLLCPFNGAALILLFSEHVLTFWCYKTLRLTS